MRSGGTGLPGATTLEEPMTGPSSSRRSFVKLLGIGGVVYASGLSGARALGIGRRGGGGDFSFVQLSDTHWGYQGPANPEAALELPRAVELVNALEERPDFVVFTGDLTHNTEDAAERRARMKQVKAMVGKLRVPAVHLLAGEHDASLDKGQAFEEVLGKLRYSFVHKGIRFVVLDNVSDPKGALGEPQIDWLAKEAKAAAGGPLVVFTHRPLFDLKADWDWTTADGAKAIEVLHAHPHATVFYGHIHQEHHHRTDHIAHHAATSLVFPLPAPGSQPKRAPIPWDPTHPGRGLGFRQVEAYRKDASLELAEIPLAKEAT
jgi:hypothetical protein